MKKFKKILAALLFAFFAFEAFAAEPYGEGTVYSVVDETHLNMRNYAENSAHDYTLAPGVKFYDENDEPIEKMNLKSLVNKKILFHYNEKKEIKAIYIMVPGYDWHEYRGKGIDLGTVEGTYVSLWDNKLRFLPYGSQNIIEYDCSGANIYNENNIKISKPLELLSGSKKIRVVYEVSCVDGNKYVRDIYMLPAQYDFASKKIITNAEGGEDPWDGWSDRAKERAYTTYDEYGYYKSHDSSKPEHVQFSREDGKYKNFLVSSDNRVVAEDGSKISWRKLRGGQYCRYIVQKMKASGNEYVIEVRALEEETKFDEGRFVPDNLKKVAVIAVTTEKKKSGVCEIQLASSEKWVEVCIDESTRFYDKYSRVIPPLKGTSAMRAVAASYYEKDGKKYLYDLYGNR
ncbi:MAG: hypothetical protein J5817_11285 [Treponema sp.]|nr:hypothetical protein [Treponema sp.]